VAFESSKADFRNIFSQLVAVAKARWLCDNIQT
jgi:hypothetical protein